MPDGLELDIPTAPAFLPLLNGQRFQGARGGRGSGKSWFFMTQTVEEMFAQHTRIACVREVQNSIKDSIKQGIEDAINRLQAVDVETGKRWSIAPWFKITEREIVAKHTDSLAIFRGLQNHTAASIKSLEGFNRAHYEEAQTLTQRSLDLAIPTFRAPGTQQRFSWNPEKQDDPVDKFFLESRDDPDFALVDVNYWDNPWFPDDLRKDMERDKARDPDRYQWIWCGHYRTNSDAQVFRNFKVEHFDGPPPGVEILGGADWGFSVDPTAGLLCFIVGRTLYIWREVYQVGCEIDRTPALFDKLDPDWERKHTDPNWLSLARRVPIIADSARPETISYMQKHGYPQMRNAIKGAGSVEDGIEFLKSYDIVIHPECKYTAKEFKEFAYKIDKKTNAITTDLEDKGNHCIDSGRYAVENVRRRVPTALVGTYQGH
jgi:phage terminase large subunit